MQNTKYPTSTQVKKALSHNNLSWDQTELLGYLTFYHNRYLKVFPSIAKLALKFKRSHRTIQRHLKTLKERGLLEIESRFRDNLQTTNIYRVNFKKILGSELSQEVHATPAMTKCHPENYNINSIDPIPSKELVTPVEEAELNSFAIEAGEKLGCPPTVAKRREFVKAVKNQRITLAGLKSAAAAFQRSPYLRYTTMSINRLLSAKAALWKDSEIRKALNRQCEEKGRVLVDHHDVVPWATTREELVGWLRVDWDQLAA